jgi:hypothetical protein
MAVKVAATETDHRGACDSGTRDYRVWKDWDSVPFGQFDTIEDVTSRSELRRAGIVLGELCLLDLVIEAQSCGVGRARDSAFPRQFGRGTPVVDRVQVHPAGDGGTGEWVATFPRRATPAISKRDIAGSSAAATRWVLGS